MAEVILVAGRGPMAARAIRSAQLAGAKVVAVHSEAETDALHVRLADEAVLLGGSTPESSYLDRAALREAALVSGAEAVLPVHAVLAGASDLAREIRQAGLIWVGAEPEALQAVEQGEWASAEPVTAASPGWVIGVADEFRLDGVVVRRTQTPGATLWWSSATEPAGLPAPQLPPTPELVATLSDVIVGLGWRGLVSITLGCDGSPLAIRGGLPRELGMVELRTGRDLIQSAIALAGGGRPPEGSRGVPAAMGAAVRATAVPGEGQRFVLAEFSGPAGDAVQWEPGYAAGDYLWPWYDPVLGIVGACADDLTGAADAFLGATAGVSFGSIPNDLEQLRACAYDVAGRLRDGVS